MSEASKRALPKLRRNESASVGVEELEQRALAAWREIFGVQRGPLEIEVLQHESPRSVVRLRPRDAAAVIAKRCPTSVAHKERAIYATVLPELPLPSLHLHGVVAESPERAWLLLEDADTGAIPYDPHRENHRTLAGRWLGLMHSAAERLVPPAELTDRGPASFREDLRCLCAALESARSHPALSGEDLEILATMLAHSRVIASHWMEMEAFCGRLPRTLVHGDFKEDHVRIREDRHGPAVLVFDWNDGGWGVPALDAAKFLGYSVRPELSAYHAAVMSEPTMAALDLDTICRLGFVGEVCRSIASARWEAEKLAYEWVEGPMANLRLYASWIADVVRAEPWAEHPAGGAPARIPKPRAWY